MKGPTQKPPIAAKVFEAMIAEVSLRHGLQGYGARLKALALLDVDRRCTVCGVVIEAPRVPDIGLRCLECRVEAPALGLPRETELASGYGRKLIIAKQRRLFERIAGDETSAVEVARQTGVHKRTVWNWKREALLAQQAGGAL